MLDSCSKVTKIALWDMLYRDYFFAAQTEKGIDYEEYSNSI